ncbi:hypothetical protein ABZ678_32200 [Streptomyces hirsutus]|uniref:hypothetical protein n=1 Tax=Streptomyces hirsutus TaxID=35620 RepID=UPI0033E6333B
MDNKEAQGCLGCLGVVVLGAAVWLIWKAVQWVASDWHWAWALGAMAVVPVLSFAVIIAWRAPQPVVPADSQETWLTAVGVSVTLVLTALVLCKGWGTAIFALALAAPGPIALAFTADWLRLPRIWPPQPMAKGTPATANVGNSSIVPAEDAR